MILFAGVILGIGNSAFHPADYSILSASMDEKFMGRAFSLHSFSGNLGNAIAPAVLITITAFYNWRISLMVAGIAGIVVMAGLLTQWKYISEDSVPRGKRFKTEKTDASTDSSTEEEPQQSTMEVMRYVFTSPAILFLFLYYCMNTLAGGGLRNFAVAGLVETHGATATVANAAFTAFLIASAAGVLVGGLLADYTRRHELIAAVGLAISAGVLMLVGAYTLPMIALVIIFSFAGLTNGLIGPARDMLIRRASPKGAVGKVFGFVFSGQTIGQAVAPLMFGLMIDSGVPAWIFYTSAIFTVLCMVVVLISAKYSST
jgi:FSR family fosmidomycin resistance protein-like MFS transporter